MFDKAIDRMLDKFDDTVNRIDTWINNWPDADTPEYDAWLQRGVDKAMKPVNHVFDNPVPYLLGSMVVSTRIGFRVGRFVGKRYR